MQYHWTWPWLKCVHIHHPKIHCCTKDVCCSNLPDTDIPGQESDRHISNTFPSIGFNIYHLIASYKIRAISPLDDNIFVCLCLQAHETLFSSIIG